MRDIWAFSECLVLVTNSNLRVIVIVMQQSDPEDQQKLGMLNIRVASMTQDQEDQCNHQQLIYIIKISSFNPVFDLCAAMLKHGGRMETKQEQYQENQNTKQR